MARKRGIGVLALLGIGVISVLAALFTTYRYTKLKDVRFLSSLTAPSQDHPRVLSVFEKGSEVSIMDPVVQRLREAGFDVVSCVVVSRAGFSFKLPVDIVINAVVAEQSPSELTRRVLDSIDTVLARVEPRWVVVQGDTTTAMAAAMSSFFRRIPVVHIDAGLRTYNLYSPFPEEMNRRVISAMATLHMAPTLRAADNLSREGVPRELITVTGSPIVDALTAVLPTSTAKGLGVLHKGLRLVLLIVHRSETVGKAMKDVCAAATELVRRFSDIQVAVMMDNASGSSRTTQCANSERIQKLKWQSIGQLSPLLGRASLVLTDSTIIQAAASHLAIPVLLLRPDVAWPGAAVTGLVRPVGTSTTAILAEASRFLIMGSAHNKTHRSFSLGEGHAAELMAESMRGLLTPTDVTLNSASLHPAPLVPPNVTPYTERGLEKLLAMPSHYVRGDPRFEWTAIVSAWNRPQTHPPKEIWLTVFASNKEAEYREAAREFDAAKVKFISGDIQTSYWGRFGHALFAHTPYVILYDDDSIPGARAAEQLLHIMHITTGEYYGMLGMKGHKELIPIVDPQRQCKPGFSFTVTVLQEADVVGGFWALKQDWLRLLFHESPITWFTGEDYHLSFSLMKYAGLRTFLAPMLSSNPETWYQSHDYMDVSVAGDTTVFTQFPYGNVTYSGPDLRLIIATQLWMRGHPRPCIYDAIADSANVLLVAETLADADCLAPVVDQLRHGGAVGRATASASHPAGGRLWIVSARTKLRSEIARHMGFDPALFVRNVTQELGAFDLNVGAHWPRRERPHDALADALRAMGEVIDAVEPPVIILPARPSPILAGVAFAAHYAKVPVVARAPQSVEPWGRRGSCGSFAPAWADACFDDSEALADAVAALLRRDRPMASYR